MKKVKKIVIYGDSISTVNHGDGGYEGYLRDRFAGEVINYAIGSSGLTLHTPDNTAAILADSRHIPADADLIIMWHGSNDWYWGSPIGTLKDEDSHTFLGAVGEGVRRIRQAAPNAVLVWLTPIYRYEAPDQKTDPGNAYETENKIGNTMMEYYHGLELASVRHGFPLIDIRRYCGIHEVNQELYLEDRVHPCKAGYERIWKVMERELVKLLSDAGYEC